MAVSKNTKIFKNDIGVAFRVFAGIDLTDASEIIMKVKKPSGTEVEWTAIVDEDNSYYAYYASASSDLDLEGQWRLSLEVTFPDTSSFQGETAYFTVYKQFEDESYGNE